MKRTMDSFDTQPAKRGDGTLLLLRHCHSIGQAGHRVSARARLDEVIGRDFARRLVTSLLAHSRR